MSESETLGTKFPVTLGTTTSADKARWIVEQAVILKTFSQHNPWDLDQETRHVIEALALAEKLLEGDRE